MLGVLSGFFLSAVDWKIEWMAVLRWGSSLRSAVDQLRDLGEVLTPSLEQLSFLSIKSQGGSAAEVANRPSMSMSGPQMCVIWPMLYPKHSEFVSNISNGESSYENPDFWLLLKYQKIWHPWAHILQWLPLPKAESRVWLLRVGGVYPWNTAAARQPASATEVIP